MFILGGVDRRVLVIQRIMTSGVLFWPMCHPHVQPPNVSKCQIPAVADNIAFRKKTVTSLLQHCNYGRNCLKIQLACHAHWAMWCHVAVSHSSVIASGLGQLTFQSGFCQQCVDTLFVSPIQWMPATILAVSWSPFTQAINCPIVLSRKIPSDWSDDIALCDQLDNYWSCKCVVTWLQIL